MTVKCALICASMNQYIELSLSEYLSDMSSVDFSKCTDEVYEDCSYRIDFICDQYRRSDLKTDEEVRVRVNGKEIGIVKLDEQGDIVKGSVEYKVNDDDMPADRPFFLHYGFVSLSFIMTFADSSSKEYVTKFLLCISKSPADAANIEKMFRELIAIDDAHVGEWIFSDEERDTSYSLYEGTWNKRKFKSLSSYIQLLEQIIFCYKNNFVYFKTQGKHTIKRSAVLVSYENAKTLSRESFHWIMQNADQLADVPFPSGVRYLGKIICRIASKRMPARKVGTCMRIEWSLVFCKLLKAMRKKYSMSLAVR